MDTLFKVTIWNGYSLRDFLSHIGMEYCISIHPFQAKMLLMKKYCLIGYWLNIVCLFKPCGDEYFILIYPFFNIHQFEAKLWLIKSGHQKLLLIAKLLKLHQNKFCTLIHPFSHIHLLGAWTLLNWKLRLLGMGIDVMAFKSTSGWSIISILTCP